MSTRFATMVAVIPGVVGSTDVIVRGRRAGSLSLTSGSTTMVRPGLTTTASGAAKGELDPVATVAMPTRMVPLASAPNPSRTE